VVSILKYTFKVIFTYKKKQKKRKNSLIKNCKNSIFLGMQVFNVFGTISANSAKKALFCLVSDAEKDSGHNIPPPHTIAF